MTQHAIDEDSLVGMIRGAWRWQGLPLLIRRHPRIREEFPLGVFWKRSHVWFPFAAVGWILLRRTRFASVLMLPYLAHALPKGHTQLPRGRIRAAIELPGRAAIDASEMAALAWGSVKHRCLFL